MTEPTTPNQGFIVPNTGDLVGAWGTAAINPNMLAQDGLFGGVASISLGAATTIVLTTPSGSITPSAGPNQSQNFMLSLSGTLTGNAVLQFTLPGRYLIFNNCVAGSHYVQLAPSAGTGRAVGVPPGELWHAAYDGTHMYLAGLPHVGTFLDLCVSTTPAWMNAFSVAPYLLANGATYSSSIFPTLAAYLGTAFGGNGITTFGVPDVQNRYRIPLDFGGNNRVTNAGSGIDGTSFGASGGSQALQQHTHTVTDPGHAHPITVNNGQSGGFVSGPSGGGNAVGLNTSSATTNISVNNAGTGLSGNIPPGIVAGMTFIKT